MDTTAAIIFGGKARKEEGSAWTGWMPVAVLPTVAFVFGRQLPGWVWMWLVAFALYFGCKWVTWWQNRNFSASGLRELAYLLAWPGMDAKAFLNPERKVTKPLALEWAITLLKIICGAGLLWVVARRIPSNHLQLQGWVGLAAIILILHFGTLHLIALGWQFFGVDVQPLMNAPIKSTSLAEFWGLRWNSAFNRLVHDGIFRRIYRVTGSAVATMAVFLASGLVHDLVISVPARGGYGLPTLYFLIQGAGVLFERTAFARRIGLRHGIVGCLFTVTVTVGPVCWLFHPAFVARVILPFLRVLNAI